MISKLTRCIIRVGRSPALRVAGTAIGLLLLVHSVDLRKAAGALAHGNFGLELLGIGLTGLGLMCGVRAWGWAVGATGSRVALPHLASWYLQGVFVGQVTPTGAGGDATRALRLGRIIGHGPGVASMTASRIASGTSMALWGFIGALVARLEFGVPVILAAFAYLTAMIAACWLALGAHTTAGALRGSNRRLLSSIGRLISPVTEALQGFRRAPVALGLCLGLAVVGCLLNIFAMQTFGAAVGVHQPAAIFAVAIPISLIATMAPFAINGIGLREGVMVGLLVHLGSSAANAGALALLMDLQLLPFALVGATLFLRSRRRSALRLTQSAAA
jgi:glycosyltransferase 2 family protein